MPDNAPEILIEDATLIYKNFSGKPTKFKTQGGVRTFNVVLEDEKLAKQLEADTWNIKWPEPKEIDGETVVRKPHLPVEARFDVYPPKVTVITDSGRTIYTEAMMDTLDWADIRTVDLIIRGNHYDVNGKQAIKAYLKTMFITIEENALEAKYALREE